MATSSTTFQKKWRMGNTKVVRVPEVMAEQLLVIARKWDEEVAPGIEPDMAKRLVELDAEMATPRSRLWISNPGTVLFYEELDMFGDRTLRVVATGLGGAKLSITEGRFGFDEIVHEEIIFDSEEAASDAAERYRKTRELPASACSSTT
jgi:hypothetical protein